MSSPGNVMDKTAFMAMFKEAYRGMKQSDVGPTYEQVPMDVEQTVSVNTDSMYQGQKRKTPDQPSAAVLAKQAADLASAEEAREAEAFAAMTPAQQRVHKAKLVVARNAAAKQPTYAAAAKPAPQMCEWHSPEHPVCPYATLPLALEIKDWASALHNDADTKGEVAEVMIEEMRGDLSRLYKVTTRHKQSWPKNAPTSIADFTVKLAAMEALLLTTEVALPKGFKVAPADPARVVEKLPRPMTRQVRDDPIPMGYMHAQPFRLPAPYAQTNPLTGQMQRGLTPRVAAGVPPQGSGFQEGRGQPQTDDDEDEPTRPPTQQVPPHAQQPTPSHVRAADTPGRPPSAPPDPNRDRPRGVQLDTDLPPRTSPPDQTNPPTQREHGSSSHFAKRITEVRKEFRMLETKMSDKHTRTMLRRWVFAVETILEIQFEQRFHTFFDRIIPHLSSAFSGNMKLAFDETWAAGEFAGTGWEGIVMWVESLLTPEIFSEAQIALTRLHEGSIRQLTMSLQDYYHVIKHEFRKVPDLSDRERLELFRTGLRDDVRAGSFARRETGTMFTTMEELFHYLQLDESRKHATAKGKSLTNRADRHQSGGYGFNRGRSAHRKAADTRYPNKNLAVNRVHFSTEPFSASDSDSDSDSVPSQGDQMRSMDDTGRETDSRPSKSPKRDNTTSRMPAGPSGFMGRGGRSARGTGRGGALARTNRPHVFSLQGDRALGYGSIGGRGMGRGGRGIGQGVGRGRGDAAPYTGGNAPDFTGQDPHTPMHMNKGISVGQAVWLQKGARCFFCFRKLATCTATMREDRRCNVRGLHNWPTLSVSSCPDWKHDNNGPIPVWN